MLVPVRPTTSGGYLDRGSDTSQEEVAIYRSAIGFSLLLVFGVLTASPGWAAGLPTASPDQVGLSAERLARIGPALTARIKEGQFPGAVALVARKGRVAYFETFGLIDYATGVPMPKDAIFRLRSMVKPFTSVAAMILVEEGRLVLNDPIAKFLPPFAKMEVSVQQLDPVTAKAGYTTVPAERQITIQDLLRHTSGLVYGWAIPNAPVKELYATTRAESSELTPAEQIQTLAKIPLAHHPGTAFEYGMSADVLGRVIEAITDMSLGKFMEQRIFAPLQMTDSGFVVPQGKLGRLAQAFATNPLTGNPIRMADVTALPKNESGGAGGVGTAGDYVRFLQMLLNGGQLDGIRLLSRTTVRHMTSDHLGEIRRAGTVPLRPPYGFGLGFAVRKETGIHFSTGSAGEFFWSGSAGTAFWVDPKEELICILMTQGAAGAPRDYDRYQFKELVYQALND